MTQSRNNQMHKADWQGFIRQQDIEDQIQKQKHDALYIKKRSIIKNKKQKNIRKLSLIEKQFSEIVQLKKKSNQNKNSESFRDIQKSILKKKLHQKISFVLPSIKIIRIDDNIINYGRLVYKGIRPRTSDKFIKYLKQMQNQVSTIKQSHLKNLIFCSKFQCGNIDSVFRKTQNDYDLHMRVDTNTQGHRQWYYFSVKNKKQCKVTFNIYEFSKSLSLYQRGMKPYVFSKKLKQYKQLEWIQSGQNIKYRLKDNDQKYKKYILTFEYDFSYQNDQVYFAACPPYSYSYLNQRLSYYQKNCKYQLKIQSLTQTLCGLNVPLITIYSNQGIEHQKKFIVIIGRTHPGQTCSSWVVEGILSYFNYKSNENNNFLNRYILKIVPMMNPDGVYVGNYRTGILGFDYNRIFNSGKSYLFPQCSSLKKLIKQLKTQGTIQAFIDIHGHSIKRNCFIFGPNEENIKNSSLKNIFGELSRRSRYYKQTSCKFNNDLSKLETARMYFQIRQNLLSLTFQNSLGLYNFNDINFEFMINDWMKFGSHIIQSINQCYNKHIIQPIKHEQKRKQSYSYKKYQAKQQINIKESTSKTIKNLTSALNNNNIIISIKKTKIEENKPFTNTFYSTTLHERMNKIKNIGNIQKINNNLSISANNSKSIKSINKLKQNIFFDNVSQDCNDSLNDSDQQQQDLPQQLIRELLSDVEKLKKPIQDEKEVEKNTQTFITKRNDDIRNYMFHSNHKNNKKQFRLVKEYKQIGFELNGKHKKLDKIDKDRNKQQSFRTQPTNFQLYLSENINNSKYRCMQQEQKLINQIYGHNKYLDNTIKMYQMSPLLKILRKKLIFKS